jgi:glycosyltransferase involved in cell wall biosynthesis
MARIAIDATYVVDTRPTGTSAYSRRLIESLAQLGAEHDFSVCYRLSRWRKRREFLRPPGFSVRLFEAPWTFWTPSQADLFHSLAQRPPAFRFKREIVTVHDIFPITGRDYSTPAFQQRFSALLREAVRRATRIICDSEYTASQLDRHCGVDRAKIRVIPCGVDLPGNPPAPEECRRERECLVGKQNHMLLSVGVLETRKNTINMVRALKLLPERYHLVLAGGDGFGSGAIRASIAEQGMEPRVTLLGYIPNSRLPLLYSAASAFLFPSLEEGFGLPALEAMAHGLPVVTSRTSALPEVAGDAALYVDPLDPRDIASQACLAVENDSVRSQLVEKGLARAREFTWKRTAEETLKVYNEVL